MEAGGAAATEVGALGGCRALGAVPLLRGSSSGLRAALPAPRCPRRGSAAGGVAATGAIRDPPLSSGACRPWASSHKRTRSSPESSTTGRHVADAWGASTERAAGPSGTQELTARSGVKKRRGRPQSGSGPVCLIEV
jgi:hypothetical protein